MAEMDKFKADADQLFSDGKFVELREALKPYEVTDDPTLLWRLARSSKEFAEMVDTTAALSKESHLKGFEFAKKGLEKGPEIGSCHKYYGILLSRVDDYLGTKKKIEDSREIRSSFEKALELDPSDATSAHLLGRWYYLFADLSWYERKIAAVVFGKPPEASYDEALEYLLKAEELNPNFYCMNHFLLGQVYKQKGDKVEARKWMEKVLKTDSRTNEANETIKKATDILKTL